MLSNPKNNNHVYPNGGRTFWRVHCAVAGPERIPVLAPAVEDAPQALIPFHHTQARPGPNDKFVHFFVSDDRIECIRRDPGRYVNRLGRYAGLLTPDFSLYRSMAPHQRVSNVWASRAVGAYYQERGLPVIPTVRWAMPSDYLFCFEGLPKESVLAVSTHGCIRSAEDRHYFKGGPAKMVELLRPALVLVHGAMPDDVFDAWRDRVSFLHYPSAISVVHQGRT